MRYTVEFSRHAAREFRKLTPGTQQAVNDRVKKLADIPRPHGVEKLSGEESLYRIREGEYRIVYQIQDRNLIVLVVTIGHRKDVYRRL